MGSPRGEALLSVLGLDALMGTDKVRLTQERMDEIARIHRRLEKACRDFLVGTAWEKPRSPGAIAWKPWIEAMATPPDATRLTAVAKGLHPEDAGAYVGQAILAWQYLRAQFPRTLRATLTGAAPETPSQVYVYRFRRAHAVIHDPVGLVEQMSTGMLNTDEVAALEAVYPALYIDAQLTFQREVAKQKKEHPRWDLPRRRQEPLAIFMKVPRRPGYVASLQARFAATETPKAGMKPLPSDVGDSTATPTQRAELR